MDVADGTKILLDGLIANNIMFYLVFTNFANDFVVILTVKKTTLAFFTYLGRCVW